MKTIETNVQIAEDQTLHIPLTGVREIRPGMYHVVLIIDEQSVQPVVERKKTPLKLNTFELEGWPKDCKFRREDIYDDTGR
jgi:hypothetical protein